MNVSCDRIPTRDDVNVRDACREKHKAVKSEPIREGREVDSSPIPHALFWGARYLNRHGGTDWTEIISVD